MHNELIQRHKRTVMIPKGHFTTELEARAHAMGMGYQTQSNKQGHITDNFYRYDQNKPVHDYKYREKQQVGGRQKAIHKISNGNHAIIGRDHHQLLDHESLLQGQLPKTQSLFNPQINQNGNIINQGKMMGRDGRGTWQQQYQNIPKSDLTPATPVKPWVQQRSDRIQYTAMVQPRKSYLDLTGNSKLAKKYF